VPPRECSLVSSTSRGPPPATERIIDVIVVPASTANLGPGFDVLGMALGIHAHVMSIDDGVSPPEGFEAVSARHPASVAHRRAGGSGLVAVRSSIPSGRGLGFSGAVRVGAVALALRALHPAEDVLVARRQEILEMATALEGHADNVAASLLGGVVIAAVDGGDVTARRVESIVDLRLAAWVPSFETSTASSRADLSTAVDRVDAVFNIARTALLVDALARGDRGALREATRDRLHQSTRLLANPRCAEALRGFLDAGADAAWLSGSGPTVMAVVPDDSSLDAISGALPPGRVLDLRIDRIGARWN